MPAGSAWRPRLTQADLKGPAAARLQGQATAVLRVPLFNTLAGRMRGGGRWVILDLGPARSGMVAFCSRFRCRLDIADLAPELNALNSEDDAAALGQRVEAVLPARHGEMADIVLCWDLLNYLQRPALSVLMNHVALRARKGTLVHILIVYSSARMPAQPGAYFPTFGPDAGAGDDVRLVTAPTTGEDCAAPRYTPEDLARCLPRYRIDRAVLLNNGMQEFLFRL